MTRRWLFADQLGPHFLGPAESPGDDGAETVLLIESKAAFRRRRYHRAKAHLVLSALRHRAVELGSRCLYLKDEGYRTAVASAGEPLSVVDPTSFAARQLVREIGVSVLPSRGFVTSHADFERWAHGRRQLRQEDFYREARRRTGILMVGDEPEGGRWNFDADNRLPPPRGAVTLGLPEPVWPTEDDIDAQVRDDLDRWESEGIAFAGVDGPRRFAATRAEAIMVLDDFIENRLGAFGPYEDAALVGDWSMAHSLLSAPMNMGLLDPVEVIDRVVEAWATGGVPLSSAEGFVRQVMGWRDFVWHLYWHFGPEYVATSNALDAHEPLPALYWTGDTDMACLRDAVGQTLRLGYAHHIQRLMVTGLFALLVGVDPREVHRWYLAVYVDAHEWVELPNTLGMSQYADGGVMASKPYIASGRYIARMGNHCAGCRYDPGASTGAKACPFTTLYWDFLLRHEAALAANPRMVMQVRNLRRLDGEAQAAIRRQAVALRAALKGA